MERGTNLENMNELEGEIMKIEPNLPAAIHRLRIRMNCPFCNTFTKITLISHTSEQDFTGRNLKTFGSIYYCESCLETIFICWRLVKYSGGNPIVADPELTNLAIPKSDLTYVPDEVKKVYIEALKCYGINCYNAFAAMCRRTIQKICMDKKIEGSSKVSHQAEELKKQFNDSEVSEIIDSLIISGHDGAHPHLPEVTNERAKIILSLMNDLIDQIYNRLGRINAAKESRKKAISNKSKKDTP